MTGACHEEEITFNYGLWPPMAVTVTEDLPHWIDETEVTDMFDHRRFMHVIGSVQRRCERFHQQHGGLGVFGPDEHDDSRIVALTRRYCDVIDADASAEGLRDRLLDLTAATIAWIEGIDEAQNRAARTDAARRHRERVAAL